MWTCLWLWCRDLQTMSVKKKGGKLMMRGERKASGVRRSIDRGCRIFGGLPEPGQVCLSLCVARVSLCAVRSICASPLSFDPTSLPLLPLSTPSQYAFLLSEINDKHASQLRLSSLSLFGSPPPPSLLYIPLCSSP